MTKENEQGKEGEERDPEGKGAIERGEQLREEPARGGNGR